MAFWKRTKSASESEVLADRINDARGRLLGEIGKVRNEQRLAELEAEKREREAVRLRNSGEETRYQRALIQWGRQRRRVDRIQETINFLQTNVDLLADAGLGVRMSQVTSWTGDLLGDLNLVNPNIKGKMEDFEVDYVTLTSNVKELLGGVQLPTGDRAEDVLHDTDELERRLLERNP